MGVSVAVIGGTGVFGQYIVEELLKSPVDFDVTVAARHEATFNKLYSPLPPKLKFQSIDMGHVDTLEALLADKQLVILAAGPFQEFSTELALTASRLNVHYIDICDDPAYIQRLIDVKDQLKHSDSLLLTGLSSLPGISIRLLEAIKDRFDEIEDVSIGLFIGNSNKKGRGAVLSSIDSLNKTAMTIENGQLSKMPTWSHKEAFAYPAPIGTVPSYSFNSPDALLSAKLFKLQNLRVKVGFEWFLARWSFSLFKLAAKLCGVGIIKSLVNRLFPVFHCFHRLGSERGCVSVIATGMKQNTTKTIRASVIGLKKGQKMASIPAVIAAEAIANNEHHGSGLSDPITWLANATFLERLQHKGFEVRIEELA